MILKEEIDSNKIEAEKMIEAGLHFGHKKNKKHPKMEPYIYGVRGGVNIIDVSKTEEKMKEAFDFLLDVVSKDGKVLVVGTKVQFKDIVKGFAEECNFAYVTERWLGGTLTNFDNIKKRVDYLKDLEKQKEDGSLEKYTKKEQLDISREIESLKKRFEGLKSLSKFPDVVFVLDMEKDHLAVKEALDKNIKIVAIADTNVNPELANYIIPANDDAVSSVSYILNNLKEKVLSLKK